MLTIRSCRRMDSSKMQKMHKGIKIPFLVWVLVGISLIIGVMLLQATYALLWQSQPESERTIEKSTLPLTYRWSYVAPTRIHNRPLAVAGLVILRTRNSLIALNAETGEPRWSVPAPAYVGPSAVIAIQGNTIVFASDGDSKLQAVDLRDGTVRWTQEPNGPLGTIMAITTDTQRVYIGLNRANIPVKAYDLQSGKPVWISDRRVPSGISAVVLDTNGEELYAVIGSGLFTLDSRTGVLKRTIPHFDLGTDTQLVFQVALSWFHSTLLARDAKTGNKLWQFNKRPSFFNVIGDRVYVSSDCCALHALEFSTGQLLWERPLPLLSASEVVAVGDTGYVMLVDGSILAFDTASGADRGKLETMPHSVGMNVPDRGLGTDGTSLYATFGDNKVFAFGP